MKPSYPILISAVASVASASPVMAPLPLHTTGEVKISLGSGRLEGNVCIENRPEQSAKFFALNAGLNVARVTDGDGKAVNFDGWYRPGVDGEARVYEVTAPSPAKLCVQYVGAFPVYSAHDAPLDFKGVIAFNGDSIRAAEQAVWLPAPYDDQSKRRTSDTSYDLDIVCDDCRVLYVNGNTPIKGNRGRFSSAIARPPLLFGGTGPLTESTSVTVVNESLKPDQMGAMSNLFTKIANFYRSYLGRSVDDMPTLLRMITIDQVSRDANKSSWGFATWPTIALSGTVSGMADELLMPNEEDDNITAYLAHETAHYFFGTVNQPVGPYRWFLTESTAEFLAIKTQLALRGPHVTGARLKRRTVQLNKGRPYIALDAITDENQIGDYYRYNYAPLLLLSLDREVGDKKMRAFMRELLIANSPRNWAELQALALKAGIGRDAWEKWRSRCVAGGTLACVEDISFEEGGGTSKSDR